VIDAPGEPFGGGNQQDETDREPVEHVDSPALPEPDEGSLTATGGRACPVCTRGSAEVYEFQSWAAVAQTAPGPPPDTRLGGRRRRGPSAHERVNLDVAFKPNRGSDATEFTNMAIELRRRVATLRGPAYEMAIYSNDIDRLRDNNDAGATRDRAACGRSPRTIPLSRRSTACARTPSRCTAT
jgi:hypothetical protein